MSEPNAETPHEILPADLIPHVRRLKAADFELAYLAVLTYQGIKPLSRWEKPLDSAGLDALEKLALQTRCIERTVQTGQRIIEVIFSRSPGRIRVYEDCFSGTAVDKSRDTQRIEGYLFGYPPCCIECYVRNPYQPNDLPAQDQKNLFHWACKECRITPLLLPAYMETRDFVQRC